MASPPDPLEAARRCHQAGQLRQAAELYRQVILHRPDNPEVLCLLADACHGQGKLAEAAAAYQQALRLDSRSAAAHYGLANVLRQQGQRDEALTHYQAALRGQPEHADAHTNLGILLAEAGRLEEAIAHWQAALRIQPNFAKAHHNLGVARAQQGQLEEAAASLRRALTLQPGYAEACFNLGNVLVQQGKQAEGVEAYRQALQLRPDYADAYNNLGLALCELRRPEEAAVLLQQAVRLRPTSAEAHNNLGLAYADLGQFVRAEACYQEALRLNPGYVEAHTNRASAAKEQGRLAEALAGYQLALWLKPDAVGAHWNRALAWLAAGDFEHGWPEYEWRWQRKQTPPRPFRQPRWDGSPLAGRTILIYMEQGLGDMLQFLRYARLVQERGGTVVVECPGFLVPLLARCRGIDQLVAEGSPLPAFDVQAPLLSLPGLLGTTLATVPAEVPYLFVAPELVAQWRGRLGALGGLKVGIAWQGNPHHRWDRYRSFPLKQFAPLAELPGVQLISLQKGSGAEQLRQAAGQLPVVELPSEQEAATRAFTDTAAITQSLDLVIAPDSALAHLAGALGVAVWVPLAAVADWRWLHGREDSPWYPSLRLFRQAELGAWGPVFERLTREVEKLCARRPDLHQRGSR